MVRKIESEPLDEIFTAFLDSKKASSRMTYKGMLAHWVNFSGLNGKATLDFKKADKDAETEKKVVAFKSYLLGLKKSNGEPISENYARTATGCVRGFFTSHRLKLQFIAGETKQLQEHSRSTKDYLFSKEDLAKMVSETVSPTLQEKYIVVVGKSIGLRAGDFLALSYGAFRSAHLDTDAPISLGQIETGKEHVPAYPFLDSDAVQVVKAILERKPEAKNSDKILDLTEESLSETLQRLFEKAHLVSGDAHIRFHNLRKYLIDRLSAVASESQWKQIVGKKISEGAYVSTEQLHDIYLRAMPSIVINGNSKNHVKIEELETKFADMNRLLGDQTMIIESLKQKDLERTKEIEAVKAQLDTLTHEELKKGVRALRERKRKKAKT